MTWLGKYTRWLHSRWPAGTVEKLPQVNPDGSTSVPGVCVVGDLTGIPLLKFSADAGAKAVQTIGSDPNFKDEREGAGNPDVLDLVIVGAGVSGMAAALEAQKLGLNFEIIEAAEPFSTIVNFPKQKPIYTYPTDMTPAGDLQFEAEVKEPLLDEMRAQTLERGIDPKPLRAEQVTRRGKLLEVAVADGEPLVARRVVIGIGRSGNFRQLGVPGEGLDKVYNRLHDPKDFCDQDVLVVGGGDSALETAIAIAQCGGRVTLSYRKKEFSRPKPDNVERLEALRRDPLAEVAIEEPSSERVTTSSGVFMRGRLQAGGIELMMGSRVQEIRESEAALTDADGAERTLPNDTVFSMIGRQAPLDFFRRSGIAVRGEMRARQWLGFAAFMLFCVVLYHLVKDKPEWQLFQWWQRHGWFPFNLAAVLNGMGDTVSAWASSPGNLLYTLAKSMSQPGFYYTFAYSLVVVVFGIRRIRRRRTPYVKLQTLALMAVQVLPLFLLPEIILPWLGRNGLFESGAMGWIADQLFESYDSIGHERAYWRAYGLILAWPLFIYNVFAAAPLAGWLVISAAQTFVIIPVLVYYWGKGAYCGWICSCGALAETLGDAHRHKMPHGPFWNRLNMLGQAILAAATALLALRVLGWAYGPGSLASRAFEQFFKKLPFINYAWSVDLLLAGILGVGCYFWFSGRVWCRFACPLAALMHIYARFTKFRILAEKKKCISCNVCTSVCHQGIDVMNFANKGLPMADPECVRCSACVQSCPTGVLSFGMVDPKTDAVLRRDSLVASPVRQAENH